MGLFSNLIGNKTKSQVEVQTQNVVTMPKVSLEKSTENFSKVLVNLSKSSPINLTKHMARAAMVFDYSESIRMEVCKG